MRGKILYQAGVLLVGILAILAAIVLLVMNYKSLIFNKLGAKVNGSNLIEIRLFKLDATLSRGNLWLIIIALVVVGLALLFGGTIISKLVEHADRKHLATIKHVTVYRKVNDHVDYDELDDDGFIDVSYGEYVEKKYNPKKRMETTVSSPDERERTEGNKISISGRKLIVG